MRDWGAAAAVARVMTLPMASSLARVPYTRQQNPDREEDVLRERGSFQEAELEIRGEYMEFPRGRGQSLMVMGA